MRHSLRAVPNGARSRHVAPPPAFSGETKQKIEKGLRFLAYKLARPNVPQDDLFSVALRAIHYALPLFNSDSGASSATYLLRCAYRAMVDHLRAEYRQTGLWVSGDSPSGSENEGTLFDTIPSRTVDDPFSLMLLQQVEMAMQQLPDRQRQCLQMYYGAEGYTNSEIAEQLGISRARVSQLLKSGVTKLSDHFAVNRSALAA